MKRMKRLLAVILSIALIATLFAGCSKNNKSSDAKSFGDVYTKISEMKKYDFKTTVEIESDNPEIVPNMEIVFKGTNDGESGSLGVDVSVSGITLSFDDVIILSGDKVYLNIGEVLDKLGSYLELAGVDTKTLFSDDTQWISIPSIDYTKYDTKDLQSSFITYINDILKSVDVKEDDGTFTVSIKDKDKLTDLIKAIKECIDNNGDSIAEAYSKIIKADDLENLVKEYLNLFSQAAEKMSTQYNVELKDGDKITEEDINEVLGSMGLDTLQQDTKTQLSDSFKNISEALNDAVTTISESKEMVDFELKMTAGYSNNKATVGMMFRGTDDEDTIKISLDTEITENNKASVDVPDEKVSDISEILPTILYFIYSSNHISDIENINGIDGSEEETTLSETIPAVTLETPGVAPLVLNGSTCNLSFDDNKVSFDEENSVLESGYIFLDDIAVNNAYTCISYIDDVDLYLPDTDAEETSTFTTKSGYKFDIKSYASHAEIDAYVKLDNGKYLFFEGNNYETVESFTQFLDSAVQNIEVK